METTIFWTPLACFWSTSDNEKQDVLANVHMQLLLKKQGDLVIKQQREYLISVCGWVRVCGCVSLCAFVCALVCVHA